MSNAAQDFAAEQLHSEEADEVWVLQVRDGVGTLTLARLKTNGQPAFFEGKLRKIPLGELLMTLRSPVQATISASTMDPMDKLTGEGREIVHEYGNKALGLLLQGYEPTYVRNIMEGSRSV